MAHVALEPRFFGRPVILRAGRDARDMYLAGLCYVADQLTGGFIPSGMVRRLADMDGAQACADRLVDLGLWERCEGGYQVVQDVADPQAVQWHITRERPSGPKWQELRAIVFTRDAYTCQYCGATGTPLHCDHVIPIFRGGSDRLSNLTTACEACNLSKHSKHLDVWLGR